MKFNMTDRIDRFLSRSRIFLIFDLEVACYIQKTNKSHRQNDTLLNVSILPGLFTNSFELRLNYLH